MSRAGLQVARWGWPAFAAGEVVLALFALPSAVHGLLPSAARAELPSWHLSAVQYLTAATLVQFAPVLVYLVAAAIIWWRAPTEPVALAAAYMLIAFGFVIGGPAAATSITAPELVRPAAIAAVAGQLSVPAFFFIFPDGRFPRVLRVIGALGAATMLALVVPVLVTGRFDTSDAVQTTGLALFLVGVGAQIIRYRRTEDAEQRAQVRWVVYGVAVTAVIFIAGRLGLLLLTDQQRASVIGATLVGGGLAAAAFTIVPVCITIAVLRAGLWNVDRVVNRTLVYGALTVTVVLAYVLVVTWVGIALRGGGILPSLVAAGVVAAVLQPLQRLLQRTANRLMYGLRDEPEGVMRALGRLLEVAADADTVLPAAVASLATALKVPYAALLLRDGSDASIGSRPDAPVSVPLLFQRVPVGTLEVGGRRPREPLTPKDLQLLRQVAPQLAAAANAVLLANDLRTSRARIVEAREDERRRLRRDLHDGLGPALAGLALQAGAIRAIAASDPEAAARLGDQVATGVRSVITDVRRLVYGLRPPALDEYGLVEGLQQAIAALERPGGVAVELQAVDPLPPLSAAVEVAAYRIVMEAVTNVIRHAHAEHCTVRLTSDNALVIEVRDDGHGIDASTPAGVGLLAMRERAAEVQGQVDVTGELGAGTVVTARLPVDAARADPRQKEAACAS